MPKARNPKQGIPKQELKRLLAMTKYEEEARLDGHTAIAGIDEAGRGPLAGPVVACACILPKGLLIPGVNDSKVLTPLQREELFQTLTTHADIRYGLGIIDPELIDKINIYQATIQAMLEAVNSLAHSPDALLVDGLQLPHPSIPVKKIIGGDGRSLSIAAASIIAKVTRDRLMCDYDQKWPLYGFAKHKGYGTAEHLSAIAMHGPCPIHRLSFEPFKGAAALAC